MDIMVIGSGGREHALVKALKKSPEVGTIYALPGNGGMAADAVCVNIGAKEIDKMVEFAVKKAIGFAVVAPDDPLVMGAVDALHAAGIPCFGPDKKAAIIEGSKAFSKDLMHRYHIPTADYQIFTEPEKAIAYIQDKPCPIVIKASGLALGKGVIIAKSRTEAEDAIRSMMVDKQFGDSGNEIVIEEFLTGPEVSVLCFTDGKTVAPMVSSMDHKRAGDGDTGLNTGGMGTVAPNPCYTKEIADICMDTIFLPTIRAMQAEGRPFKGCLYFGLMLTENGPKVIEYNCRFGDPETQVVLPLLATDLFTIMRAVEEERLDSVPIEWDEGYACCVILASDGYPSHYEKGFVLTVDHEKLPKQTTLFHAGTKQEDGKLVTNGGRVIGITATAPTLEQAIKTAYQGANCVHFENRYMRRDIGNRALSYLR